MKAIANIRQTCARKLTAVLLACAAVLCTCTAAFAGWEVRDVVYNEDGTVHSGTLVYTNGGEDFDPASLTWAQIPQWKADLLNAQQLQPRTTGHAELDTLVQQRLDRLITSGMSNYQKLRAVYDDIVRNCTYSIPIYSTRDGYDPWAVNPPRTYLMSYQYCEYAKYLLRNDAGVCDEFTAAFVAMANAIGFEAYSVNGRINGNGHAWALLRLGDAYYIFDPQAEQVNIRQGHVRYINFGINTTATNSYQIADGSFAAQVGYRNSGTAAVSTFLSGAAEAESIRQELIALGESFGMVHVPDCTSRFWESKASAYGSREELIAAFRDNIRDMSGWWGNSGYFTVVAEPTQNGDGDYIFHLFE